MDERVELLNRQGEKLVCLWNKGKRKTLVVIAHGFLSDKNHPGIVKVATWLKHQGFSVCRFDFTGCGESEGRWSLSVKQQMEDIVAVVDHFADYGEIVLMANSYSALPATIAAYTQPKITKLVTINGFYGGVPKAFWLKCLYLGAKLGARYWRFLEGEYLFIEQRFKPEKIRVPVLVVCSEYDEIVDNGQAEAFYQALKTKKKLVRVDADHEIQQPKAFERAIWSFYEWEREVATDY
jgi:pimeloyl-ACP methyl ester carboxylesterase